MLKVENIDVYYGAIHAVKDVSFEVAGRRDRGPDRCQRRRQEHHSENRFRPDAPPHGHHYLL